MEPMNIVGVNGCTAVFIWTDDSRLLGAHVPPGDETEEAEELFTLKGTDTAAALIMTYSADATDETAIKDALSAAGFTLAPTQELYTQPPSGSWLEFSSTAQTVGEVVITTHTGDS